ncbi:MAG: dihydrolipoamide acetyltransferase component of pyruvate dehydrogenase complex [Chloroflexota bacterium]|nr:MAG: dihydrolipoamide acetyltransferase component of pyruvate dehydrogenase complex [Chloroflexota bacterium]
MATEVIVPKVDMVMETGTFVEWLKNEGDRIEKGEPLFIIQTDKANIEVEATASGILGGLKAKPDEVLPVTQVIAYILEPGEALPGRTEPSPVAAVATAPPASLQPEAPVGKKEAAPPVSASNGKVRATPAARHLAAQVGVDLSQVSGHGSRGRVHRHDVEQFAAQKEVKGASLPAASLRPAAPAPQIPLPDARRKEVIPLVGPRKIIAERLAYSAFTAPHINLSLQVDMSEATRLRSRVLEPIQQKTGQRLSFTVIIARAVASVLPRHPYLNASLQDDQIILWADIHLGIATNLEDYLIVPVIRVAQDKNLEQLVGLLGDLLERARTKRLKPAEMIGSTFTISNLGMFGIESFTAIINPPEAAILAVGKIVEMPVKSGAGIELRPMMNLTISVDHRLVDGAAAARFLAELKDTLENPYLLI